MTKLIIQIPCFNEQDHIAETIQSLPRYIENVDEIEVLIIDDGSRDETVERAKLAGAHYIRKLTTNRGLSQAFGQGMDACFRLGADIVVNTDADNQYFSGDIEALVQPILKQEADIVVGDRKTDSISHFSTMKKWAQKLGSSLVRKASNTNVRDSTSGFRAFNRPAMSYFFIHNKFTYTLESIVHAGSKGLSIANVDVRTNEKNRDSRLAKSSLDYIRKNGPVIFRSYAMYWPMQTFGWASLLFFVFGGSLVGRFLFYYIQAPDVSAHVQSLQVGVGSIVIGFIILLMAVLSDLIASNRRIGEEILCKVRELQWKVDLLEQDRSDGANCGHISGLIKTGHEPWKPV